MPAIRLVNSRRFSQSHKLYTQSAMERTCCNGQQFKLNDHHIIKLLSSLYKFNGVTTNNLSNMRHEIRIMYKLAAAVATGSSKL